MSNKEAIRAQQNQEVIREYLIGQSKGFELTDTSDRPLSHTFTVTKSPGERYKLKVAWRQISDNTLKASNSSLS
jgi:hypothetical protein